jgi:hypothetical protein
VGFETFENNLYTSIYGKSENWEEILRRLRSTVARLSTFHSLMLRNICFIPFHPEMLIHIQQIRLQSKVT